MTPGEIELNLWHLDGAINRRGFGVDVDMVTAAIETAERTRVRLNARTAELTTAADGTVAVEATTQRDKMLLHLLQDYDIYLPDLRASTVESALEKSGGGLPPAVVELLTVRLMASTTSVSKYKRLATLVGPDGRCRYTKQFCGASRTGRWAGRGFQPDNLPRPTLKNAEILAGIEAIKLGCADLIYANPMEVLSSAIRGSVVAPPGMKLCVADLANIEGRALAWLAGEQWKLAAFREYDTFLTHPDGAPVLDEKGKPVRKGPDLYALAYANAFAVPVAAVMDNKDNGDGLWRQIGKVMELALGYEGGVGAFVTFALAYGIDLDAMAAGAWQNIPPNIRQEAERAWKWALDKDRTYGLSAQTYCVCDAFKRMWRYAHPATTAFWKKLEEAARSAIASPGVVFEVRSLRVVKQGSWLRIVMPSGRSLCYPGAAISDDGKVSYMGVNQFSRKWQRIRTYSGKLAENVTQGFARDVLAHSMPRVEREGYQIIMHVHDELQAQVPDKPEFNHHHLSALLAAPVEWAPGLPLAAEGFTAYRGRKG